MFLLVSYYSIPCILLLCCIFLFTNKPTPSLYMPVPFVSLTGFPLTSIYNLLRRQERNFRISCLFFLPSLHKILPAQEIFFVVFLIFCTGDMFPRYIIYILIMTSYSFRKIKGNHCCKDHQLLCRFPKYIS